MRPYPLPALAIVACFCWATGDPPASNARSALSWYNLDGKKPLTVDLPSELREISGLAMTEDGRLFAHDDEKPVIYQVDYLTGKIVKRFSLGLFPDRADFEGLAIVGERFFLVTSSGILYEFSEGKDREHVLYKMHRTPLTPAHDVEGVCYDPDTHSLLLACKGYAGRGYGKSKAIFAFSLETMKLEIKPRFLLSLRELQRKSKQNRFNPSAIEFHPKTKTFFILASEGQSVVEISSTGEVLGQATFGGDVHTHAEGITVTEDLTILISDEGDGKSAKLTRYPVRE